MTDAWGSLHIDVVDDEIIVTLPFTIYTVTYYKPPTHLSYSPRTSRRRMILVSR